VQELLVRGLYQNDQVISALPALQCVDDSGRTYQDARKPARIRLFCGVLPGKV
jgi:hypothetical protein